MKIEKNFKSLLFLAFMIGAFIIGLIQGITGVLTGTTWLLPSLAVLGVLIGLLNITNKEALNFMVAVLVIGIAAVTLGGLVFVGKFVAPALINFGTVVIPAGGIVAIKEIVAYSRN